MDMASLEEHNRLVPNFLKEKKLPVISGRDRTNLVANVPS